MTAKTVTATAMMVLGLSTPAMGQRADSVMRVPGITVQGTKAVTTVGGSSAIQLQLDSIPTPPAATLDQLLRRMPLLHVRTNSRGESELSARGSESRQVAVLVDGVPITLAWDARAAKPGYTEINAGLAETEADIAGDADAVRCRREVVVLTQEGD